jgi:hypothetical protein
MEASVPEIEITENYVLTYENVEHKRYADLCGGFGFDLTVSASLRVGLKFVHPVKGHIVRLDRDEDPQHGTIYEPHLLIYLRESYRPDGRRELPRRDDYDTPIYPEHYSEIEDEWLNVAMSDGTKVTDYEFLARELYIWFKVRPHSLNTQKTITI